MLICSSQASVPWLFPVGSVLQTSRLQLELTEPTGPHSSMLTTMSPTSHSTKNMKEPRMTMEGSSRRCAISHRREAMKTMVRAATVMKYGKYLVGESSIS